MLGLPASSAAPIRKIARVVIGVGMLAAVTAGCSEVDSSSTAAAGSDDIAAVAAAPTEKPVDEAERLRAALASTGVTPAFSDDMLQALGDGVCQQLAAGTDRAMIIANLRAVSLNGASEPMVTSGNGSAASTTPPAPISWLKCSSMRPRPTTAGSSANGVHDQDIGRRLASGIGRHRSE